MEFDRSLALVQGCLLSPRPLPSTTPPSTSTPLLLPRLLSVLKELDHLNLDNKVDLNRRVHLFLLINTKLPWTCDLINNDRFSSLVDIIPALDPSLYVEAVLQADLWPYLIDSLQHLPLSECRSVWCLATECLLKHKEGMKVPEFMATLTGITCSAITAASSSKEIVAAREIIKSALQLFAENLLKPAYVKDKCVIMVNVLMVLRLLLNLKSPKQSFKINQIYEDSEKLYHFTEDKEPVVDINLDDEVDVVLAMFKTLAVAFSIDTWMDWCEISSERIFPYKDRVVYWSGDQPPSNMQLIIAHLMAEVKQCLSGCQNKSPLVAEMESVIGSYANFYDRKVELNMDEMELAELMEKVRIHEGWKQKAFVEHIAQEDLEKSLEDEDYVEYLVKNPALLSEQTENIINTLMVKDVKENQKILIDNLILTLSKDGAVDILMKYVSKSGLSSKLRTHSFDQTLVSCLNKAVSTDSDTSLDIVQFLSLAVQDPRETLVELMLQAAHNKGKVELVAKILLELDSVCCVMEGDKSLLSTLLFSHLESEVSTAANKQNCFQVLIKVAGVHPNYGIEIMKGLVPSFWTEFSGGNCAKSVEVAEYIIDLLKNTKTLDMLENVEVNRLVGVLVSVLNVVGSIGRMDVNSTCALRELCLAMLNLVFKKYPQLMKKFEMAFNASSRGYFFSGETLKTTIQAHYFKPPANKEDSIKALASISEDLLTHQIFECLPNLLKSEWQVLYNLLVEINCFKSSHTNQDLEATLQAEEVNCVSTSLLDILTLLLNHSNLSLHLQKHMILSLSSTLSASTSTLTLPSCLQLFNHLLTTLLLVPSFLAEDLHTCQHSVLAALLNHEDLAKDDLEEVVGLVSVQEESEARKMGLKMIQQWIKDKPGKLL